jgi:NAD(P)-dependent dehydrogenase (short-subunit alcohol dehydrogenase family)
VNNKIKNILITGGTRGLGLEYARFLANKGYNIGITDISETACRVYGEAKSVQDILDELDGYGIDAWYESANLNDSIQAEQVVTSFLNHFGEIHAVITNAGGDISGNDDNAAGGKAENNSFFIAYDEYRNIFKRNFDTTMNTLRAVMPHMKKQGFGKVITVSSINAVFGVEKETTYSVAKSAILQLTRSLAAEVRKDGINVNCIVPGPVKTGRFMATLKGRHAHDLEALKEKSRLERVAIPKDISPLVEFLLSPASDFISGSVIKIDGGLFNQSM